MKRLVPLISAFNVLLFGGLIAVACNVPVFRYALERWQPDAYQVIVFHQGPLAPDDLALVKLLEKGADGKESPANVGFHAVDLAKDVDPEVRKIFQRQSKVELPWMVVLYPDGGPVWAGRLAPEPVRSLCDSPARRELAKRLLAGETAVFVLLECGDQEKDDGVASLLECQLPLLAKVLKLPELTDDPSDKINEAGPPLKIAFSWLRVSRSDPAERMLVEMLLHAEDDLPGRKEPMVFPVFGRGRSLLPQIGLGINVRNLEDDGAFLVGPCSCTVKRMNPGFDLLLAVDWDARLPGKFSKEPDRPKLQGLSTFVPQHELGPEPRLDGEPWLAAELGPEPRASLPAYPPASLTPTNSPVLRNILLVGLAGLAILVVATFVLLSQDRSRRRDDGLAS